MVYFYITAIRKVHYGLTMLKGLQVYDLIPLLRLNYGST